MDIGTAILKISPRNLLISANAAETLQEIPLGNKPIMPPK